MQANEMMQTNEAELEGSKRVRKPCSRCINAKVGCDHKRPCARCVKRGEPEKCFDIVRKQRASKKKEPNNDSSTAVNEFDKFLLVQPPLPFDQLQSNLDLEVFLDTLLTPNDIVQNLTESHQIPSIPISPTEIAGGPIIQEISDSDNFQTSLVAFNNSQQENNNNNTNNNTTKDIHIVNSSTNLHISNPKSNTNIHITNSSTNPIISVSRNPISDLNSIPRPIGKQIPRAIFSNAELVALDCNMAFAELLGYLSPTSVIGNSLKDFVPGFSYQYAVKSCHFFKDNNIHHYERLGIFTSKSTKQNMWVTLSVDMMELSYSLAVSEVHDNVPNCFRWTLKNSVIDGTTKKIIMPTAHSAFCPRSHCQCKLLINM